MGFVSKLRTSKHLRTLRSAARAEPEAIAEAKAALRGLGVDAIPPLLELLGNRDSMAPAREVLESLLSDESLGTFVDALGSTDRNVQAAVVEILKAGKRYRPDRLLDFLASADVPRAQVEAVLLARVADLEAERLLTALPDFEREARTILFRLVQEKASPEIGPSAAALIDHADWWIRSHMAKLLGTIPGEHAEAGLTRALGDRNKAVRLQAVKSLHRLEARSCVPALVTVLRDGDLTVQAAAIDALIALGDARTVPHLVDVLKDESDQSRRGAVEVLNEVATAAAIQDLVHALRDADWWVRVRASDALGTIGGEKVVEAILGLMDDPDVQIRRYAVEILNTIPDGRAVESLTKALEDEDWWVRERSIDALGRTGDERVVQPLAELLARDGDAAPLCTRALGELRRPEAVAPLLGVLSSAPSEELAREAVDALVKINSAAELPPDVRQRMEEALRDHGVRLEKTRLQPMEVRAGAAAAPVSMSMSVESPLHREPGGPAPELARAATPPVDPVAEPPDPRRTQTVRAEDVQEGTEILDRYTVVRQIGKGGFATVFLVEDRAISDRVILKILSSHLTADEKSAQRFVRELKLARRISHRNVIRIHDLLEIGKSRGISMEYFESRDLGKVLDQERCLSAERTVAMSRQICDGLAAAHEAGIFHRDIKPANVLVGQDDEIKLVDFGLASVGREVEQRLTRTGHLVGTPHYMAPELIRGEEVGARADLYSFGVMMYEMLAGKLPYDGDNAMAILFRHLDGDATSIGKVVPDLPAELAELIMRTMHLEPDVRPATAEELLEGLRAVET